jgi:hypothetical protein
MSKPKTYAEADKRIAELEAELEVYKWDSLEAALKRIAELEAENKALVIKSTDYKSSMEYWVQEYNKKDSENAKLRATLVIADNYLARSDRHIPYNVAVAVKGALK